MLRIVISQHIRYSFEANEKSRLGEEGKILYGNLMWGRKRPMLHSRAVVMVEPGGARHARADADDDDIGIVE